MTAAFAVLHVALKLAFKSPTTTFYLEHTIVNAVIVALVWHDTLATLFYPLSCMRSTYAILPTYAQVRQPHRPAQLLSPHLFTPLSPPQIAFHLSHIVCEFRTLTAVDWGHHLLSSVGSGSLNIYYTYGPLLNFALFFATGLPGGIDYFLMYRRPRQPSTLPAHTTSHPLHVSRQAWGAPSSSSFLLHSHVHSCPQILHSFTEKRVNRLLNILVRSPGLMMWMSFGHVTYTNSLAAKHWRSASAVVDQDQMEMPLAALLFMCVTQPVPLLTNRNISSMYVFVAGNGIYFMDRVVGSYYRNLPPQLGSGAERQQ
jgi:hypothetical protein